MFLRLCARVADVPWAEHESAWERLCQVCHRPVRYSKSNTALPTLGEEFVICEPCLEMVSGAW